MSKIESPFREFWKKYRVDLNHSEVVDNLKNKMSQASALNNWAIEIEKQCDSSKDGLRYYLLQESLPKALDSRSLNEAEKAYH